MSPHSWVTFGFLVLGLLGARLWRCFHSNFDLRMPGLGMELSPQQQNGRQGLSLTGRPERSSQAGKRRRWPQRAAERGHKYQVRLGVTVRHCRLPLALALLLRFSARPTPCFLVLEQLRQALRVRWTFACGNRPRE